MTIASCLRVSCSRLFSTAALISAFAAGESAFAGTWTPLAHNAPGGVNLMLQLSDGTILCANNDGSTIGNGWFRLTPDIHGSYVNGTWTTLASAHDTRLYFPSQVLRDGRVFIAGGEYGTGGPKAEVYDPLTNVWTQTNPPGSLWNPSTDNFYDCNSEILSDGRVLLVPVIQHVSARALAYNPATNVWSTAGTLAHGTYQDEASWVKLPDDSILTIDPFGTQSERYIPATNTWIADSNVPVSLYDPFGSELGAAFLLPNGKAFYLGATGNTAIYTPTGTTTPGTWVAGPVIPGSHGTPDAPGAMMMNGKILCAVSPIPTNANHFPSPTTFYEYDYTTNSFASVGAPTGSSEAGASYGCVMLDLPDGTVLFSHFGAKLYVYTPTGSPIAAGKPTISSVTPNPDGSFHLVGTRLNGISEGAAYGDDLQMNTNYPLVRLSDASNNVYYARTYNWSGTSVQSASTASTEFVTPASLPIGSYSLVVIANGIASNPVTFTTCTVDTDGDGTPDCLDGCPNDPNKIAPGVCGCGVPDTDSDGDGTPNCNDLCPNDPAKIAPGQCGCGVPDTDSDGDGTANCHDGCPNDPAKIAPGICGCGVPDTDSDGDGTPNCNDLCPNDSNKIAPGQCGCGVPDTDSDGDGVANCHDNCPNDPNKVQPGQCGCGIPDTDSDGDGVANCHDNCPNDPLKTSPGQCGCGVPDTDSDGDGTANCNDQCPSDPLKTAPGQCGCGVADTDSDGDGTANCNDGCPNDPLKTVPGQCGCGVPDTDSDGDGVPNCHDGCPNDPNKIAPGICGCGVADTDSDGDGTPNCNDLCPNDANKIAPGQCGCGVADTDSDGDGVANCNDGCPNDPLKTAPGICGCGIADTDSDGDGTPNCNDLCPNDASKIAPGQCGCGVPDTDSDGDGVANCNDGCPNDAAKTAPGQCGCGNPDTDTDGDGIADCHDNCVNLPNPGQEDCNQNGIGDVCDIASGFSLDVNADSIPDDCQGAGVEYCFGDGSGASCPCGNTDGFHSGCKNSTGDGARLYDQGGTSFANDDAVMTTIRLPHNKSGLLFMGKNQVSNPFGDGRLCISTSIKRFAIHSSGASGSIVQTNLVANSGGAIQAGSTWNFQAWYRDPQGPCGGTFNLSNAVQITFN